MTTMRVFRYSALRYVGFAAAWTATGWAHAGIESVRINEILAGYNGNSSIQFVELLVADDASKAWGPGTGETTGRAQLEFYNAQGERTGRYVFSNDAPAGGKTVLIATQQYAGMKNALAPDFLMLREITPISGKVCFANNPDNPAAVSTRSCVSYGAYTGAIGDEGAPVTTMLPILGASALKRTSGFDFNTADPGNVAFTLGKPTPANTAIASVADIINNTRSAGGHRFAVAATVKQGQNLFMTERFEGNGRTCGTCHLPPLFNMTPAHVVAKKPNDPLFIAERGRNINQLVLTAASMPSDLRGVIKDARGNAAQVVKGSSERYQVINGARLSGAVTDASGNRGVVQSFTAGDLRGPNPVNGSNNGIEDPTGQRLRHSNDPRFPQGRALVLENIDGFDQPEVFRRSPHLLNIKDTAPYGFSGEFATLDTFTANAVKQHFPLSLQRREGIDFRTPTTAELNALVAFQQSITLVPPGNPRLALDPFPERYNITTLRQIEGAATFGVLCGGCHSGPKFAHHFDQPLDKTLQLATGVANSPINSNDALPSEPPTAGIGNSTRSFDTPPLLGIRHTAPYFHDGSANTLEEAIDFYNSPAFKQAAALLPQNRNGGPLLADPNFQINAGSKNAIVSFLRTMTRMPVDFPRGLSFGTAAVGSTTLDKVSIKNTGPSALTIKNTFKDVFPHITAPMGMLNRFDRQGLPEVIQDLGAPASLRDTNQFVIHTNLGGRVIEPGQSLDIDISFIPTEITPANTAFWSAMLNLQLEDANEEPWDIGIQLIGKAN